MDENNTVTISMGRLAELIKTECTLGLVRKIYEHAESYNLQDHLSLLFGPVPKKDDE